MDAVSGSAAGVPFTALPPKGGGDDHSPLIVTWHMLDAPRTDPAFAAALPMAGVPAWRVHLGMPMCGARMIDGRIDAVVKLVRRDALAAFLAPVTWQAADEFPAALNALRDRLSLGDGPVSVLGASLGGAVALQVVLADVVPVDAIALVNPAVRVGSGVKYLEAMAGHSYEWTDESHRVATELDFVSRIPDMRRQPPVLVVSGENDHRELRADAIDFVASLQRRYAQPDAIELVTVPGLAHPLAEEPGMQPAPQLPSARAVDDILTDWFLRRLST